MKGYEGTIKLVVAFFVFTYKIPLNKKLSLPSNFLIPILPLKVLILTICMLHPN